MESLTSNLNVDNLVSTKSLEGISDLFAGKFTSKDPKVKKEMEEKFDFLKDFNQKIRDARRKERETKEVERLFGVKPDEKPSPLDIVK